MKKSQCFISLAIIPNRHISKPFLYRQTPSKFSLKTRSVTQAPYFVAAIMVSHLFILEQPHIIVTLSVFLSTHSFPKTINRSQKKRGSEAVTTEPKGRPHAAAFSFSTPSEWKRVVFIILITTRQFLFVLCSLFSLFFFFFWGFHEQIKGVCR